MRNDSDDDLNPLLRVRAERRSFEGGAHEPESRAPCSHGFLWVVLVLLVLGGGFGAWWTHAMFKRVEQQLVATQNSFARISEETSHQIRDLTTRFAALRAQTPEAHQEALQTRVQQLEQVTRGTPLLDSQQQLLEHRQTQTDQSLSEQTAALSSLTEQLQAQQAVLARLEHQLDQVEETQIKQGAVQDAQIQDDARLSVQLERLEELARADKANAQRVEQDLVTARAQLERLSSPSPAPTKGSTAVSIPEFDLYRAQTTRQITTLQGQIANLQMQLDRR